MRLKSLCGGQSVESVFFAGFDFGKIVGADYYDCVRIFRQVFG